jgi:transposase
MAIYVFTEPVDFRKGIDTLAALCRRELKKDPFSGSLFVFCSRSRKALKILAYDGQGFWLCLKRLSQGRLRFWPKSNGIIGKRLAAHELQILLWNGNPHDSGINGFWREIAVSSMQT